MTTPVSAPKIEAETDVSVETNIDIQICEMLETSKRKSKQLHFDQLRTEVPMLKFLTDEEIEKIYELNNSHSQSKRSKNGEEFQKIIEDLLQKNNIPYARQVPIDNRGMVVKNKRGNKVVDIVIGNPIVGQHISNYIVISLKKSSRERHSEDDWMKVHAPKLYLYGTVTSDYPDPEKFEESDFRKIVCVHSKKDDTRKFKLSFNDLCDLVRE